MKRNLQNRRKKYGFTQKTFAKKLGISIRTYQNIEQSVCLPRKKTRDKIMKLLNENSLDLFEDENSKEKRGRVSESISKYMSNKNKQNKQFTKEHITIIRKSIKDELLERRLLKLDFNTKSKEGNNYLNERVANIANEKINKSFFTYKDIKLFKQCKTEEYQDRTHKCVWGLSHERERQGFDPVTGYEIT